MAQGQAVTAAPLALSRSDDASASDRKALEQYQKIIQLRDAVLSGQHPTIKLPPGVAASKWSPSGSREASQPGSARQASSSNLKPTPEVSASRNQLSTASRDVLSQSSYAARTADINPLFLQKSDELIRAEFHVQRNRLEQALAVECAQQRSMAEPQDMYSDTELTMFLAKALELVQPALTTPADAPVVEGAAASANEAASDSFDDDTFYSSKHPTPETPLTSRIRKDSAEAPLQDVSAEQMNRYHLHASIPTNNEAPVLGQAQPARSSTQVAPLQSFHVQPTSKAHDIAAVVAPSPFQVPGLNNYIAEASPAQAARPPADSAPSELATSLALYGRPCKHAQEHLDDIYMEHHPPSPLVRTLDAGPAAPRSESTWPTQAPHSGQILAATHAPPMANASVAPAQVAALRNEPVSVDSPESSPQSGKEKRKAKKKKRKAERQAPEEVMPQIKPEPRSPSPINAPSYIRPKKRQRQTTRSGNNSDQDEVMIPAPMQPPSDGRYYEPTTYGYGATNGYSQRAVSASIMPAPRYDGAYEPQPVYAHQPPPTRYLERPPPSYARPPSLVPLDSGYRDPQPVHRERYESSSMSVRPDADPYMGQPMPPPPPQRVFVDSSGREYLEPPRPPARQSVAPPPAGREFVYEQPPPRAVSRYPGHPSHEDQRDVVYAGYSGPRRVVTQPEYVSRGYAEPPPREYSARPAGQPHEYVQVVPPGSHYGGEPPRDHSARTGSVRPAEPIRYEYGRMQSARPEPPRLEGNTDAYRANSGAYRVEYMAQPPPAATKYRGYPSDQQYYEQPHARQGGEVTYIERAAGAPPGTVYR